MEKPTKPKLDEVKRYLWEEKFHFDSDQEKGDRTLKCPSCGMDDFAHADGVCELDVWRKIIS